jgi:hypothetical protein
MYRCKRAVQQVSDIPHNHTKNLLLTRSISIQNLVDSQKGDDIEFAMRIDTNIDSRTTFYTDLNGFQVSGWVNGCRTTFVSTSDDPPRASVTQIAPTGKCLPNAVANGWVLMFIHGRVIKL